MSLGLALHREVERRRCDLDARGPTHVFAVLGTDLGTERGATDVNKRDLVKQLGRRNADDLLV